MKIFLESQISIPVLVEGLREGKTIVYPTETCYGLGCDAMNQSAVDRIFFMKERQKEKPMLVLVSSIEMAKQYTVWNPTIEMLAKRYWPGPLTIVAQAKDSSVFAEGILGPREMLAFRLTDHPLARELTQGLGKPIVSTSANISSLESPYDIQSVIAMFSDPAHEPDIVIDAGVLPHHSPSTIVRVLDGTIQIVRQGETVIDSEKFQ